MRNVTRVLALDQLGSPNSTSPPPSSSRTAPISRSPGSALAPRRLSFDVAPPGGLASMPSDPRGCHVSLSRVKPIASGYPPNLSTNRGTSNRIRGQRAFPDASPFPGPHRAPRRGRLPLASVRVRVSRHARAREGAVGETSQPRAGRSTLIPRGDPNVVCPMRRSGTGRRSSRKFSPATMAATPRQNRVRRHSAPNGISHFSGIEPEELIHSRSADAMSANIANDEELGHQPRLGGHAADERESDRVRGR